jgi:hypothetical protein
MEHARDAVRSCGPTMWVSAVSLSVVSTCVRHTQGTQDVRYTRCTPATPAQDQDGTSWLIARNTRRAFREERDALRDALALLAEISGDIKISDGDMACTLAYWAFKTLRETSSRK